jgi:hypothetical protein
MSFLQVYPMGMLAFWRGCFSPPKGIDVISTQLANRLLGRSGSLGFSPPKGIDVISTVALATKLAAGRSPVSVPRRGLMSFLRK